MRTLARTTEIGQEDVTKLQRREGVSAFAANALILMGRNLVIEGLFADLAVTKIQNVQVGLNGVKNHHVKLLHAVNHRAMRDQKHQNVNPRRLAIRKNPNASHAHHLSQRRRCVRRRQKQ